MKSRVLPAITGLIAPLLFVIGLSASYAQSPTSSLPQSVRDRLSAEGHARVIVELPMPNRAQIEALSANERPRARRAEIRAQREGLINALRNGSRRIVHEFADTPYVALDVDAAALAEIESAFPALQLREDKLLAPTLFASVPMIEADLAQEAGLNGSGAVVAVIDSGVDTGHPFFGGRVVEEACYATAETGAGGDCPNGQASQIGPGAGEDCTFAPLACRHGTHVAGIAAGAGTDFSGVAPGADLISIRVFHASTDCVAFFEELPCPRAFESDIVAGLERVYELRDQYNIAAVNMSLGGTAYDSACDAESPLFSAAINNLKSVGIATVAASGNDGLTIGIAEPACVAAAISVGATTSDDQVAWFSNSSADLDLLAPGSPIYSSIPGGDFDYLEGTSMAAPHVAGALAIYRQAFPSATVDEALATLVSAGLPIEDWRGGVTVPRIRIGTAVGLEAPVPILTPDATSVAPLAQVTVTLTGGHGGGLDWIGLAELGAPATSYLQWTYVGGGVRDTTWTVTMPSTPGDYEFRLFLNDGFTQIAASPSVAVVGDPPPDPDPQPEPDPDPDPTPPSLAADITTVAPGEQVTITLADSPGNASDWLALAPVGAPATTYLLFTYVGAGVTDRSWTVTMPSTLGDYEVRLFLNGGYAQAAVSPAITVDDGAPPDPEPEPEPAPPSLTADITTVAPGEQVTITLADSPGNASDWLALAPVGAPATTYLLFTYVGAGVTDRSWTVTMPSTLGDYEVRLFLNNGYTQAAVSPTITVDDGAPPDPEPEPEPAAPSLTPDLTSVMPGAQVTITLADSPGNASDWLALAPVGAPATTYLLFTYVGAGVTDRSWTVTMPSTLGDYEVRLFLNGGYTQAAVSPAITVDDGAPPDPEPEPEPAAPSLVPNFTTAAPGAQITVTLADSPGNASDWLALAPVGAPATSYLLFTYVGAGITDRSWTVTMPSTLGDYEFRLFLNNGYTQASVSPPVTVQ